MIQEVFMVQSMYKLLVNQIVRKLSCAITYRIILTKDNFLKRDWRGDENCFLTIKNYPTFDGS